MNSVNLYSSSAGGVLVTRGAVFSCLCKLGGVRTISRKPFSSEMAGSYLYCVHRSKNRSKTYL